MKTKENQIVFKTFNVIELNDTNLNNINGGTSGLKDLLDPSSFPCDISIIVQTCTGNL